MEDSYTVHRRRKAAAKKREKTPDPKKAQQEYQESGEDDSGTRAKMERMVEDTENMGKEKYNVPNQEKEDEKNESRKVSHPENQMNDNEEILTIDETLANQETIIKFGIENPVNNEVNRKSSTNKDELDKFRSKNTEDGDVVTLEPRDSDVTSSFKKSDIEKPAFVETDENFVAKNLIDGLPEEKIPVKNHEDEEQANSTMMKTFANQNREIRTKKRTTKDKYLPEKRDYETDSSDGDKEIIAPVRRRKTPEVIEKTKISTRKSRPPSNDTDEDRNTSNNESISKSNRDKRNVIKHRYSTGTEDEISTKKSDVKMRKEDTEARQRLREKRSASRHRYPSDTDEDLSTMKKSESFPQKTVEKQIIRRSTSEIKKQIIPLSDDSLIKDFAKAQEDYLRKERGILAPDFIDDDHSYSNMSDVKVLRKRKVGVLHPDPEEMLKNRERESAKNDGKKKSWFSWLPFFSKKQKVDDPLPDDRCTIKEQQTSSPKMKKMTFIQFLKALHEIVSEFKAYVDQNPRETGVIKKMRNTCIGELILIIIYCGLGAFVFRFTEGAFETFYKCGVKRVKRDFLDNLWNYSHNMREDDWKSMARRKLMEFEEQLHNAHEAGVHSYSGQKSWTFLNAVSYCLTVITTIGYGHIAPRTMAGRAITIVYAIFGIPIFLIVLADFGKLFTRIIKFLWAFVRRLYYTGSCRRVRRTGPVQEVMKGVQLVYDLATFRRPSQFNPEEVEEMRRQQIHAETVLNLDGNVPQPETPGTPAMSNFAIDDEFNLPISVAITILLGYIFVGATAYHMVEHWNFFDSFYFVFISMSTIGFGDFVPENPIFMMFSIIYLVFGLALTSMCINVVQTVLSDSFKQASQKISSTIGFEVPPEEGEDGVQVEVEGEEGAEAAEVEVSVKKDESREEIAS